MRSGESTKAPPDRAGRTAWALGLGFFLFGAAFLARQYDDSAFTYAVVAEQGLYKVQQAAHPLYVPLLRLLGAGLRALGVAGPLIGAYQLLSLAAAGAFLAVLYLLTFAFAEDGWASLWAVLCLGLQRHFWTLSMQTKPYTLAALAAAVSLLLFVRGERAPGKSARAGAAAGLSIGFDAFNVLLLPAAWLWSRTEAPARGRRGPAAFAAAALAFCVLYALSLPQGPLATLAGLYAPPTFLKTSLYHEGSLRVLARAYALWLGARMPEAAAWLAVAALALARGVVGRDKARVARAVSFSSAVFLSFSAGFIVFHAANDYVFAAALGAPALLACLARRDRWVKTALAAAALATGLSSFQRAILPLSREDPGPAAAELRFLSGQLGSADLLVVAGTPDWRIAYFDAGRFGILRCDMGAAGEGLFAPLGESVRPEALSAVDAVLRRGGRALLAGDAMFRPDYIKDPGVVDAYQAEVQKALLARFTLGRPLVSPQGQYYYPVLARGAAGLSKARPR